MKEIKLSHNKVALVDDEDYEYLNQWKWNALKKPYMFYAVRTEKRSLIKMHRLILGLNDPKKFVDHRDRNGLNNQRNNIRICTQSQNEANKVRHKVKSSKYFGVSWSEKLKKWCSRLFKDGVRNHLGLFENEEDAAIAYNNAAKKYHGEFANLNSIP